MNQIQQLAGCSASRIKVGVPWVLVLVLSAGVAYAMNTAAVRALSTHRPTDAVSKVALEVSNLCALDVDGALLAGIDRWVPAGRSAFCHAETYPGVPGRNDMATQSTRVGPLQATITFVAPTDIRINLYCPTGRRQRSSDANFVSALEALHMYEEVCAPAGSSD